MANNPGIYNAVITGSTGGFQSFRWITEGLSYTTFRNSILIIADLIDSKIPSQSLSNPELRLMQNICSNIFATRYPPASPQFNSIANSIVELWTALRGALEAEGGSVPNGSIDGQILYWDESSGQEWLATPTGPSNGQIPVWDAGNNRFIFQDAPSLGALAYFDDTFNPVGLWNFDNTLADISGNGNDFTISEGNVAYADIVPGKTGLYVLRNTRFETAGAAPELQLTGDMTGMAIIQCDRTAETDRTFVFRYGGSTDTEPDNILFTLGIDTTTAGGLTSPRRLVYFSEHGAGINDEEVSGGDASLPPVHNIEFIAFRRQSDVIRFYSDGVPFGPDSSAIITPTGGTTGRMLVGCSSPLGGGDPCINPFVIFSLKIIDRALSDAEIIQEYNRTMGQAFGQIS